MNDASIEMSRFVLFDGRVVKCNCPKKSGHLMTNTIYHDGELKLEVKLVYSCIFNYLT